VSDRDPYTAAKDPDDVKDSSDTAGWSGYIPYLAAEGHEGKEGDLKALQAERNANDGEAKNKPAYEVFDAGN
jgi:hypothetical protein